MKKYQENNWHTIEEIKSMGNKILTNKGEEGLYTQRGNTYTVWKQDGEKYQPINAYIREYFI